MKKLFPFTLVLVLVLLAGSTVSADDAQKLYPYDVRLYSGQSALSFGSGASGSLKSKDGSRFMSLEINETLGQFVYYETNGKLSYGPSFGQKYNTAWFAPMLSFSPWPWVSLTTWNGIYFGEPKKPSWKVYTGFAYQAIDFRVGKKVGFGSSLFHYMSQKPMHLPYIRYTLTNESIKPAGVDFSITYNVRDGKPMFFVQGFYNFQ
jgi:hypothetical protein